MIKFLIVLHSRSKVYSLLSKCTSNQSGSYYPFMMFLFVSIFPVLHSCEDGDELSGDYRNGVFVVNEGAFLGNNGSISWYNSDTLKNNLFEEINGRPLGDVVQSFFITGKLGFAVVNNSQKVEVIDLKTFQSKGVITGLTYPRYFVANETLGFISDGNFAGKVLFVDLQSLEIVDEISVGNGPEQMIIAGNKLYVANSGGWGDDNTVSVIDILTRELIATIETGDTPFALQMDSSGHLWVLCRGKVVYDYNTWEILEETESRLIRINTATNTVNISVQTGSTGDFFWPTFLVASGDKSTLFFNESDGIFSLNTRTGIISEVPVVSENFRGFGVHPVTGDYFGLHIPNFTGAGTLRVISPSGILIDELLVGIGPSAVVFPR